jgi:ribonuclease HI
MYFDESLMKTGAGAGPLFISPLEVHIRYIIWLHFAASNNVAEYEALINGLRITIELGVIRLDARVDSQLIIDQVMKNARIQHGWVWLPPPYCEVVRHLEDKFFVLELNHIARRYKEITDELAKIGLGQTTVPPNVFSRDIYEPSVVIKEAYEPAPNTDTPLVGEPEAMQIDGEQGRTTLALDWWTPYLEFLL